jgi:hypothetical protein
MNKNLSFNTRYTLYILGYHLMIIAFLILLLYKGIINFDLLFTYTIIINPLAYKSVFYYLYGHYGFLGIIAAHIINSGYLLSALFYNQLISKRILFIHAIIPLYGSLVGYLFFKKIFINFGFFGEILGYIFTMYTHTWKTIIFYCISCFLAISVIQLKNIVIIINFIYTVLEKIKIIPLIKYLIDYLISWFFFFIPSLQKKYKSRHYVNIECLIHKSIYADFYTLSQQYSITIPNQNEKKEEVLPYKYISINHATQIQYEIEIDELDKNLLLDTFAHFGMPLTYVSSSVGPLLNTIIVTPEKEVKFSRINQLLPDIARIIGKSDIRLLYPVENKPHSIAFEYSHGKIAILNFFQYANDDYFLHSTPLTILLGLNSIGEPYYIDIAKAPHILLAGTTGSGKSNILNLCIIELIWKNSYKTIRLILLDPKKSEFFLFQSLPHLLLPIAQSLEEIEQAVLYAVAIMEERYTLFNECKCKNIYEYNEKYNQLNFIVMIIDEYADIVIQSKTLELKIIRLLQMSRAAGIHVIIATQRPSSDIISSIVKSNLPMRIACKVVNSINSRIILDLEGAEKLLGNSDMLLFFNNKYDRIHGLFISTQTIEQVVDCFNNT